MNRPQSNRPPRPTLEWINSAACEWPVSVKQRACEIIKLRADVHAAIQNMAERNMMEPGKVEQCARVADLYQQLANSYRNLSKELVYYLTQSPD